MAHCIFYNSIFICQLQFLNQIGTSLAGKTNLSLEHPGTTSSFTGPTRASKEQTALGC